MKTQISRRVWSIFAIRLKTLWVLGYTVPCEDADQTAQKRRLIWVFAGPTCNLVGNAVPRLKWDLSLCFLKSCISNKKEAKRKKANLLVYAPNEDSNQPVPMSSLINVFVVRIMKLHLWLSKMHTITKTYLYNFDPLKPHFYIVKLGFTGLYIIFLFSAH